MADPKKVLIVDDDDVLASTLADALMSRGFETRRAASAPEVFDLVRAEAFDAIVLDVMLSYRTEGFQIAFDLGSDEATRSIPIVMLTGVGRSTRYRYQPAVEGKPLPISRFLEKPVREEVLCEAVESVVRRS